MAKKYVTQEVYDALKGIASDKNEFEYLTSVGATKDAEGYREAAKPKYDVVKAYSPELHNTLQKSNSGQARDILKEYAVKSNRSANDVLEDIYGFKVGYEGNLKAGGTEYNNMRKSAQPYYEELGGIDPSLAAMAQGMDAQQLRTYLDKNNPAKTDYTPSQAFSAASDTFLKRGDDISRNIDTMYFDPTYGSEIRENYTKYGGAKAKQAAANAASGNGGNFDSFSEYNKNATDLSYRIAGDNAIQAMREGYANGQTKLFDVWGNTVNTSNTAFGDYDIGKRSIESAERIADMEDLTARYGYNVSADTQKYLADIELGKTLGKKVVPDKAESVKPEKTGDASIRGTQADQGTQTGDVFSGVLTGNISEAEEAELDELTNGGQNPYNHLPETLGLTSDEAKRAYDEINMMYNASGDADARETAELVIKRLAQTSPKEAEILQLIFFGKV